MARSIPPQEVRHFHVMGGGCFGTQYVRWLLRARNRGMVKFEKIFAIDRNPQCQINHAGISKGDLEVVNQDWVDYFSNFLLKNYQQPLPSADQWVPSPLAPPIIFLGFLKAAHQLFPQFQFEPSAFREEVKTPVQIPLPMGTYAVSFAEWQCPVNCIEPATCPAIHAPRTWDMKPALEKYFQNQAATRSSHVLQCLHLVHGVGTVPCRDIFSEFRLLLKRLAGMEMREVAVATVSACHGLIGVAQLSRS